MCFYLLFKFINDLSCAIDLDKTLSYAQGLYYQIIHFKNLPKNICDILELHPKELTDDTSF